MILARLKLTNGTVCPMVKGSAMMYHPYHLMNLKSQRRAAKAGEGSVQVSLASAHFIPIYSNEWLPQSVRELSAWQTSLLVCHQNILVNNMYLCN